MIIFEKKLSTQRAPVAVLKLLSNAIIRLAFTCARYYRGMVNHLTIACAVLADTLI
jgi:hypothetical protein